MRKSMRHRWAAWHVHLACRAFGQWLLVALCLSAEAPRGWAATATAGYDYYAGPGGQVTHGPLGALTFAGQRTSLTVGAVRYDDNQVGPGLGLTAGAGLGVVGSMLALQASGTRFVGDDTYRGWRLRAGPQLKLPLGPSVAAYLVHNEDNAGGGANGVSAEAELPMGLAMTGRASASYARLEDGTRSSQVTAGLGFNLLGHLALTGDLGLAKNGAGAGVQPFPAHKKLIDGLPLLGGGGQGNQQAAAESQDKLSGTVLLGVRVTFP